MLHPRSSSLIFGGRHTARSNRSERVITAPMPLSITGLCALMMYSSPLVYSCRPAAPPPVAIVHSASEVSGEIPEV